VTAAAIDTVLAARKLVMNFGKRRVLDDISLDVGTDLRLDLDVTELLQVFDGDVSEVRLSVKARLVDLSSHALLAVNTFTYTEDGVPPNPAAGAAAADRAAARFLEDLQAFVAASLAGVDCPE